MTREERLAQIARELYDAKMSERGVKADVEHLRDEFFRLYDDGVRGKSYKMAVKTIEVPQEFFEKTGMSMEDFVKSRFPNWDVEHIEKNTATGVTVIVLKQNYKYIPGTVDIDDGDKVIRVSKEISEYTPDIDWDTLQQERPDIFKEIAKKVITYEIDEKGFSDFVAEKPEDLATLQRHMKVRSPSIRATARRVKKDE